MKGTPYMFHYCRESQISFRVAQRSIAFQMTKVFCFSIGYNRESEIFFKKIVKNWKLKKSQITFCEDHQEENSGEV